MKHLPCLLKEMQLIAAVRRNFVNMEINILLASQSRRRTALLSDEHVVKGFMGLKIIYVCFLIDVHGSV